MIAFAKKNPAVCLQSKRIKSGEEKEKDDECVSTPVLHNCIHTVS